MERIPLLDNAKFILIFFVVFGHMIEPIISTDSAIKIIYLSIYSFHMPGFVVISGMLSKSKMNQKAILKAVKSILVPFVVFTVSYELLHYVVKGDFSPYTKNLQPYWILWFLYSLFIWRLLLPIFSKIKFPITISILIAIGAGYFESIGLFLGLSRTLYFFPFFIIGHKFTSSTLVRVRERFNSKLYLSIFLAIIVFNLIFFTLFNDMDPHWLYGTTPYSLLGNEDITAGVKRFLLFSLSLATVFSILMLTPNKKCKILSKGKNSLQVYVWHGFFIKVFIVTGIILSIGSYSSLISIPILFCISALLTLILSQDFIAEKTQIFIIGPIQSLMFKG